MSTGRQQPRDDQKIPIGSIFAVFYAFCRAHVMCITVFTRHSFGVNAFEPHGIIALVMMLVGAGTNRAFWPYGAAWFLALVGQRIQSFRMRWKGETFHSRYQGFPWLAMLMPHVKTEAEARRVEPFICLFGGMLLFTISEPIGVFVAAGFVTLALCMGIEAIVDRRRVQVMFDAEVEMRYYADRYRERR